MSANSSTRSHLTERCVSMAEDLVPGEWPLTESLPERGVAHVERHRAAASRRPPPRAGGGGAGKIRRHKTHNITGRQPYANTTVVQRGLRSTPAAPYRPRTSGPPI